MRNVILRYKWWSRYVQMCASYLTIQRTTLVGTFEIRFRTLQWRSQARAHTGTGPGNARPCQGKYMHNFKNLN